MNKCDAISIGGGPAGCAFAIELARKGMSVLLIEKSNGPHHKVCGDFLSQDTISFLRSLEFDVFAAGAVPTRDLRIIKKNRSAAARLPFPAAALSRRILDEALIAIAGSSGVRIVRGEMAREIVDTGDGVRVRTGHATHSARFAAVATGKHSMSGIRRPSGRAVGFKTHLELGSAQAEALSGQVCLATYRGGYQGLQMVDGFCASLCWIVDRADARKLGNNWTNHRDYLSRHSGLVGDLLRDSRVLLPRPIAIAGMPFGHLRRDAVSDRIFAIGDQLGTIPSFAGDGIAIALASGILAARSLCEEQATSAFHRRMRQLLARQFRLAGPVHYLMTNTVAQTAGVGVLRTFPGLMRMIASATRLDTDVLDPQRDSE